ncbi:MAG: type II toxin-antitoxin system death-on-curing family toxin [Candidatus Planktophila sp.]
MSKEIDYLDFHDIVEIAAALIPDMQIRDEGLIKSAAERPRTTVFGDDAYETFDEKAAALMHSLARNHPLIDGNKRIAWSATRAFCLLNGREISLKVDAAEKLVLEIARGEVDVKEIAKRLKIKDI